MTIKYTPSTLKKTEGIYEEAGYTLRYEKGQFASGYCVVEERKVVVINKFLDIGGRINVLIDLLPLINVVEETLGEEAHKWYRQLITLQKEHAGANATNPMP